MRSFEELSAVFHLPIEAASQKLCTSTTQLKKRCRALGIARWPYRKMQSLESLKPSVPAACHGDVDREAARIRLDPNSDTRLSIRRLLNPECDTRQDDRDFREFLRVFSDA